MRGKLIDNEGPSQNAVSLFTISICPGSAIVRKMADVHEISGQVDLTEQDASHNSLNTTSVLSNVKNIGFSKIRMIIQQVIRNRHFSSFESSRYLDRSSAIYTAKVTILIHSGLLSYANLTSCRPSDNFSNGSPEVLLNSSSSNRTRY
jgi:hypothetical protein